MKNFLLVILMSTGLCAAGQQNGAFSAEQLPYFKAVSHPFMPTITSEYFYFSKDGLMWFSTARGLSSFDGSEVVQYSTQLQAYQLGLNRIRSIAEDANGNLYIGGDGKLSFFDRKSNRFFTLGYAFEENSIPSQVNTRSIYIDEEGQVFIGTDARGLLVYKPALKSFTHVDLDTTVTACFDEENLNTVSSIAAHATDRSKLWLGTFNGIYLFDKSTKKLSRRFRVLNPGVNRFVKCPTIYDIRKLDVADDSTIWFSTASHGFGRYNTRSGDVKLFLHDGRLKTKDIWKAYNIREFARWNNGTYIVGITDPNPAVFDTKTERTHLFQISQRPYSYDDMQYVANDRGGNVWILSKGTLYVSLPELFRLRTVDISHQPTPNYLSNRLGEIFYDTTNHHYYAAVPFSSGVYVLDSMLVITKIIPVPLISNKWTYHEASNEYITKDGNGTFWTSGTETYVLRPGKNMFEHVGDVFPSLRWINDKGEAWDVRATNRGDILLRFDSIVYHIDHRLFTTDSVKLPSGNWARENIIGTTKISYDGLRNQFYFNDQHSVVQYDLDTKRMVALPHDLLVGSSERDWKPVDYALDVQGRIFNSLNRLQVIEYALDGEGRIWVWIPRYGIRILDPDKMVCIDSIPNGSRGFINGNFNHIRFGGKDCMFFVGLGGIVVYNYKQEQSVLFDANNGWSGEFDYFKGYCNNHLFIGSRNEIEYFNLADFPKFQFKLQPLLNTVMAVGAGPVYTRAATNENVRIELPHNQNSVTFSFSAAEFFFPERIEYAYQLAEAENGWQYTNSFNRKITYTQLAPGTYVFRLKAQIAGGNWQVAPAEYLIIIRPALWQTWQFKAGAALLLLLLTGAILQWRVNTIRHHAVKKSLHEKELLNLEAKALRAQMNPHFISNCMNSIKSLIQQDEKDKAVVYLTTFSRLIRTIFENSDKREVTLFDELETCRLYTQLEALRFDNKFHCRFDVEPSIDLKSIMIPALIIQPFIENAIWHGIMPKAEGGTVVVTVNREGQTINCIIADDGIGRELSIQNRFRSEYQQHQSRGLHLTQARLDLDNLLNERKARMEIIDRKNSEGRGAGTTVILKFNEF